MTRPPLNDPAAFGPQIPRPEPEPVEAHDWRTAAPRWLLLVLIAIALVGTGSLGTALMSEKSEREKEKQARIDAAILDTPSRYQARLSERVAVLETEGKASREVMQEQTIQLRALTIATTDLAVQFRLFNQNQRGAR